MKVCTAWMPAKWYSAASDFIIMPPLPLTLSPAPSPFLVIFVNVTVAAFTLLSVTSARMGSQSQSRQSRLVVSPLWGCTCTRERLSVRWNAAYYIYYKIQGGLNKVIVMKVNKWIKNLHYWGWVQEGYWLLRGNQPLLILSMGHL